MARTTKISYGDATWSPWWGCRKVSSGCANCYAEALAKRMRLDCWGDSPRRMMSASYWRQPERWNRAAARGGKRIVVLPSLCDPFEGFHVSDPMFEVQSQFFALVEATPNLTWLLLTKRPENVAAMVPWRPGAWPENVWLGFTAEDQERLDERAPVVLAAGALHVFVSVEPMLGPTQFRIWDSECRECGGSGTMGPALGGRQWTCETCGGTEDRRGSGIEASIQGVIVGGESGSRARPCNIEWIRDVVRQCREAGIPSFVKQIPGPNRARPLTDPADFPEDLRIRELPWTSGAG